MYKRSGFTIVELLVAMTVLVILATITTFQVGKTMENARDVERTNDVASLARRLEQAYTAQELGSPSYPSTTQLAVNIGSLDGTVARLDAEVFQAPDTEHNSVIMAETKWPSTPLQDRAITVDDYVYQPLASDGTLCTGTVTCVRFFLFYKLEVNETIITIKSIHQQ